MSLEIALRKTLTEQQTAFVHALADGCDSELAAIKAGYSALSAQTESCRLLRQPTIIAAVQIAIARAFAIDSAVSAKLLRRFVTEEKWDPKIRLAAANSILNRAGHIAPKAQDASKAGETPLNEMSMGELRTLADKLEGEIAGRAKEVSSATAAPRAPQVIEDIL